MAISDDALVSRVIADGDQRAFALLVERYQSQVRGYLRGLAKNTDLADELAQDTFIKVWDRIASYAGGDRFAPWLIRIAHNEFLQMCRRNKRYRAALDRAESDAMVMITSAASGSVADELPDLPKYMAVLDEDEQLTMSLFYASGMTHQEISDLHGVPLGTIKSRIHRGKAKIRERFLPGEVANG